MRKSEAIEHFGSQLALADALGIRQPSVSDWTEDGIPALRQLQIEHLTGGALKADPSILAPADMPPQPVQDEVRAA